MTVRPDPMRLDTETESALDRLGEIYAASGRDLSPAEDAAFRLRALLTRMGADAGFVATMNEDGDTVDVVRVTPASENFVRLAFPLSAPYPLAATLRNRQPLFIGSNFQMDCEHPGLVRIKAEDHACATLALTLPVDVLVGAVNVTFEEPHEFTPEERASIEEAATECAAILGRYLGDDDATPNSPAN